MVEALTLRLDDSDEEVRKAAADALGAFGAPAATPAALETLATRLRSKDSAAVAAGKSLKHLSTAVAAPDRPRALSLFASLATDPDPETSDTGYVCLRNILATGPILVEERLSSLPEEPTQAAPRRRVARPSRRPR